MDQFNSKYYPIYANFLNKLAKDLTKFYYKKLDKPFKISNKLKGKGIRSSNNF
jgi:myo-inositol-1(or 4)-monophosphatase